MNKQRFKQIVKDYTDITVSDRIELHELVKEYPYSQVIHTLVAKANNDAKTDIAQQTLNYAALYATDRTILKAVINAAPAEKTVQETKTEAPSPAVAAESSDTSHTAQVGSSTTTDQAEEDTFTFHTQTSQSSADDIAHVLYNDLEQLKQSKAKYMESPYIQDESAVKKTTTTKRTRSTATRSTGRTKKKASTTKQTGKKEESSTTSRKSKSKKEDKPEKEPSSSKTKKPTVSGDKVSTKKSETEPKAKLTTKAPDDGKSPSEVKNEEASPKKKVKTKPTRTPADEQRAIIEKFIDKEPRISAKTVKAAESDQRDLSAKSTAFTEDLISENLAQILIAQGKREKAIEIYKKLIWKFPQKKSYFATQIKDLKK